MRARQLRADSTDAERKLWRALSARKVGGVRFNRQVPIGPFICDFVSRGLKLAIEVDGGQHALQAQEDARRTRYLETQGFRVIRFWNNDVLENLEGVVDTIARTIADLPSPNPSRKREGSLPFLSREREGGSLFPSRSREGLGEGLSKPDNARDGPPSTIAEGDP